MIEPMEDTASDYGSEQQQHGMDCNTQPNEENDDEAQPREPRETMDCTESLSHPDVQEGSDDVWLQPGESKLSVGEMIKKPANQELPGHKNGKDEDMCVWKTDRTLVINLHKSTLDQDVQYAAHFLHAVQKGGVSSTGSFESNTRNAAAILLSLIFNQTNGYFSMGCSQSEQADAKEKDQQTDDSGTGGKKTKEKGKKPCTLHEYNFSFTTKNGEAESLPMRMNGIEWVMHADMEKNEWVALRLWIFVLDPDFKDYRGLRRQMKGNLQKRVTLDKKTAPVPIPHGGRDKDREWLSSMGTKIATNKELLMVFKNYGRGYLSNSGALQCPENESGQKVITIKAANHEIMSETHPLAFETQLDPEVNEYALSASLVMEGTTIQESIWDVQLNKNAYFPKFTCDDSRLTPLSERRMGYFVVPLDVRKRNLFYLMDWSLPDDGFPFVRLPPPPRSKMLASTAIVQKYQQVKLNSISSNENEENDPRVLESFQKFVKTGIVELTQAGVQDTLRRSIEMNSGMGITDDAVKGKRMPRPQDTLCTEMGRIKSVLQSWRERAEDANLQKYKKHLTPESLIPETILKNKQELDKKRQKRDADDGHTNFDEHAEALEMDETAAMRDEEAYAPYVATEQQAQKTYSDAKEEIRMEYEVVMSDYYEYGIERVRAMLLNKTERELLPDGLLKKADAALNILQDHHETRILSRKFMTCNMKNVSPFGQYMMLEKHCIVKTFRFIEQPAIFERLMRGSLESTLRAPKKLTIVGGDKAVGKSEMVKQLQAILLGGKEVVEPNGSTSAGEGKEGVNLSGGKIKVWDEKPAWIEDNVRRQFYKETITEGECRHVRKEDIILPDGSKRYVDNIYITEHTQKYQMLCNCAWLIDQHGGTLDQDMMAMISRTTFILFRKQPLPKDENWRDSIQTEDAKNEVNRLQRVEALAILTCICDNCIPGFSSTKFQEKLQAQLDIKLTTEHGAPDVPNRDQDERKMMTKINMILAACYTRFFDFHAKLFDPQLPNSDPPDNETPAEKEERIQNGLKLQKFDLMQIKQTIPLLHASTPEIGVYSYIQAAYTQHFVAPTFDHIQAALLEHFTNDSCVSQKDSDLPLLDVCEQTGKNPFLATTPTSREETLEAKQLRIGELDSDETAKLKEFNAFKPARNTIKTAIGESHGQNGAVNAPFSFQPMGKRWLARQAKEEADKHNTSPQSEKEKLLCCDGSKAESAYQLGIKDEMDRTRIVMEEKMRLLMRYSRGDLQELTPENWSLMVDDPLGSIRLFYPDNKIKSIVARTTRASLVQGTCVTRNAESRFERQGGVGRTSFALKSDNTADSEKYDMSTMVSRFDGGTNGGYGTFGKILSNEPYAQARDIPYTVMTDGLRLLKEHDFESFRCLNHRKPTGLTEGNENDELATIEELDDSMFPLGDEDVKHTFEELNRTIYGDSRGWVQRTLTSATIRGAFPAASPTARATYTSLVEPTRRKCVYIRNYKRPGGEKKQNGSSDIESKQLEVPTAMLQRTQATRAWAALSLRGHPGIGYYHEKGPSQYGESTYSPRNSSPEFYEMVFFAKMQHVVKLVVHHHPDAPDLVTPIGAPMDPSVPLMLHLRRNKPSEDPQVNSDYSKRLLSTVNTMQEHEQMGRKRAREHERSLQKKDTVEQRTLVTGRKVTVADMGYANKDTTTQYYNDMNGNKDPFPEAAKKALDEAGLLGERIVENGLVTFTMLEKIKTLRTCETRNERQRNDSVFMGTTEFKKNNQEHVKGPKTENVQTQFVPKAVAKIND